jgi:predicted nucleic-acid-binding protein
MQAVSTHMQTDVLARAIETVLNNDEINVERCKEREYFHWDKREQILK